MSMIDYIRNLKRLLDMEEKKHNTETIKELFLNINDRIDSIEYTIVDHRDLLVKLVNQSNQIVKLLSEVQIEDITDEFTDTQMHTKLPQLSDEEMLRIKNMSRLVKEVISKDNDLKELEEELEKVKELITPNQVGEA